MAQKKTTTKQPPKTETPKDLCPVHQRKLEVICVNDQVRICTNCALFGDHKNHDIREEAEVLKEISLRAELLIDIYELIEQNKSNLGDQKDIEDLYNQFMTKQIALKRHVANKFKEYYNELLRKEKDVLNSLEKNFESIEKTFEEIKQGPKKVMVAAEEWCRVVQDKMEKFSGANPGGDKGNGPEYIAFEMLEDPKNEQDIIRVGEKVLEDLDKQTQPPVPQLQEKLKNLTVQFDEHFNNKLMMLCHVPNVFAAVGNGDSKDGQGRTETLKFQKPSPETESFAASQTAAPINKTKSTDKNLLEDDDNLLSSFTMGEKGGADEDLMGENDEINFLNDIPDPTDNLIDPDIVGNTDKAYDVISDVLENGRDTLDLSNRKLGDEFFLDMIESIIDFAEGEPLSLSTLNFSNNEITDKG